ASPRPTCRTSSTASTGPLRLVPCPARGSGSRSSSRPSTTTGAASPLPTPTAEGRSSRSASTPTADRRSLSKLSATSQTERRSVQVALVSLPYDESQPTPPRGPPAHALPSSTHPQLRHRGCRLRAARGRLWRRRALCGGCGCRILHDCHHDDAERTGGLLQLHALQRRTELSRPAARRGTEPEADRTATRGQQPPLPDGPESLQSPAPERRRLVAGNGPAESHPARGHAVVRQVHARPWSDPLP